MSFREPLVQRFFRLSGWTVVYVLTSQAELALTLALAYGTQGGASAYLLAFTFFQLPYGILAVSITTPLVPRLAERAADDDVDGFRRELERGMAITVAVTIPAAVAYAVVAGPVMRVLLQRGQASAVDAVYVAHLVQIMTVGLVPYSLWVLLLRAFYALQDTRTPVFVNFAETAVFVVLDLALYPVLRVEGLAWVNSTGYAVGAAIAIWILDGRLGAFDLEGLGAGAARVAGAAVVMGLVMWSVVHALAPHLGSLAGQAAVVVLAAAFGAVAFLAAASLAGVDEVTAVTRALGARRRGGARPPTGDRQ